jgi:hypothetical protein
MDQIMKPGQATHDGITDNAAPPHLAFELVEGGAV